MALEVSPLAPKRFPGLPEIDGLQFATAACGVKYRGRPDVCLMVLDPGSTVAGVLTRSKTASAPVEWCRAQLPHGRARAVIVNSGNANAFTGKTGETSVKRVVQAVAGALGCRPQDVLAASTGVIGEPLPTERIIKTVRGLPKKLKADGWKTAARAIMTTDTYPKGALRKAEIGGNPVTLAGIAKGSGMIAPDMGTMLSFAFTDARLPGPVLQALLRQAADRTFNCITVDGDTSTSDTLLLGATGKAKHPRISDPRDPRLADFRRALEDLLRDLAQQVVRDGEGASKFITINVRGAASQGAARRIGLAIGNSPLVKTAIAGEDANWGRIVMAVGKSGERADRDRLSIAIGGVQVAEAGEVVPGYDEAPVAAHMKGSDIDIDVDIGIGRGRATVWTCDLTHGYISINADYRS
ncbi:bifunctional glutamate N-acetyltransferase/amino-acid acetyltransferase ArgJ [Pelagibius marinus]|uniref:bifunctional glutamate N-acetyltransferase/amino-acid acetyltransferase ArgJ n=1 Tax=Pelagibius marinus TaxID=2762760 RepID=UPI001872F080|nr:bifunctional glutamate N-acetyltransferase/amino-acid acetyltransferase ArgJ [Pelagibius marinus]